MARAGLARRARQARDATELSQAGFAARFGLAVGTVRDREQARSQPDAAAGAPLTIIAQEPAAATRAVVGD